MRIRMPALASSAAVLACVLAATPAGAAPPLRLAIRQASASLKLEEASLSGVAVVSPHNVWAVGADNGGLIAHWNGTRWSYTIVKAVYGIQGITAISPSDIWAVASGGILHWNGHVWSLARYPIEFSAVSGSSASNVWAGGSYSAASAPQPQNVDAALLHWTGRKWFVVPVQGPKGKPFDSVDSLAATGPDSAWATADVSQSGGEEILIHWNGKAWRPVPDPAQPGATNFVEASTAVAAAHGTAWAFGWTTAGQPNPQIMYWNGKKWRDNSGPLGQQADYSQACFEPNGTGWAIGDGAADETTTGISRWTGKTWTAAPVEVTGMQEYGGFSLIGCGALSDSYAWAVGTFTPGNGTFYALALHWNGKIWS